MSRGQKTVSEEVEGLLAQTQTEDEEVKDLIRAIANNTSEPRANFQFKRISDGGMRALAVAVKDNTTVTRLNLSSNHISPKGAAALAQGLKHNKTIARLNLHWTVLWRDNGVLRVDKTRLWVDEHLLSPDDLVAKCGPLLPVLGLQDHYDIFATAGPGRYQPGDETFFSSVVAFDCID
ncbi:hypothetical protein PTSG_06991, partial [Salpingoeca rosetta]